MVIGTIVTIVIVILVIIIVSTNLVRFSNYVVWFGEPD